MKNPLCVAVLALAILTGFAEDKAAPDANGAVSVRLRFVPEGGPWRGESAFDGAAWTKLGPGLEAGVLMMRARAGIGDKFPVQEKEKVTLFEVKLVDGNDEHLTLEIRSKAGAQKIDVTRNNRVQVEVEGVKYGFTFPTQEVAAAPNELPSTNKATIIVTRKKA